METLKVFTKNKAQTDGEIKYDLEFTAKIKTSEKEVKYGKNISIKTEELWN